MFTISELFVHYPDLFSLCEDIQKISNISVVTPGDIVRYCIPLQKLECSVYPEVQKSQEYIVWLHSAIQTLSPDIVGYLRTKHRILDLILKTFHLTTQHSKHEHLPHHVRVFVVTETIQLLGDLQLSDNIVIGCLSILLLQGLRLLKVIHPPLPVPLNLSPSFYQPSCLHLFTSFIDPTSQTYNEFLLLNTQFNHFDSWLLKSEYELPCISYLATSDRKSDHIKFAQSKLKTGDKIGAISVLERCERDNWPDIYRLLARLYLEVDPGKALQYASKASKAGDALGASVHADILDSVSGTIPSVSHQSASRVQLVSHLIAKLDPSFAYHAASSGGLGYSGFINYLSGAWEKFSNDFLREALSRDKLTCIICLSQIGDPTTCAGCGMKVCSPACQQLYKGHHQLFCGKAAPHIDFYVKKC